MFKNCSFNSLENFLGPPVDNFVKSTRRYDGVIFCKMSVLSMLAYPDLHMSVSPAILKISTKQKGENSWHMT
jgi:hypothetical protein